MTTVTIKFPQLVLAADYHEFSSIRNAFNTLSPNAKVTFKEVGFNGIYHAVFHTGKITDEIINEVLEPIGFKYENHRTIDVVTGREMC